MDEQLWTDFFKILNLSFQKKPALIEELFQLKCLKQLLENLIGSDNSHSCSEVNIPTMGPSINHKMEQFLELIMINSPRNAIEEFISISISLLTKDSTTESSPRRTEVLLNISKILALNTPVFAKTISRFYIPKLWLTSCIFEQLILDIDQVAELYNELQSRSFQAILLFVNQQENGTTSRDAIQ